MYGFSKMVEGSFSDVEQRVIAGLKEEGFGVLTEIDIQATLKAKLDVDKPAYKILGACNPALANQALDAEPDIGLLLPCNVVVRQESEGVIVAFMDPAAVLTLVNKQGIAELAGQVREKLQRVMNAL